MQKNTALSERYTYQESKSPFYKHSDSEYFMTANKDDAKDQLELHISDIIITYYFNTRDQLNLKIYTDKKNIKPEDLYYVVLDSDHQSIECHSRDDSASIFITFLEGDRILKPAGRWAISFGTFHADSMIRIQNRAKQGLVPLLELKTQSRLLQDNHFFTAMSDGISYNINNGMMQIISELNIGKKSTPYEFRWLDQNNTKRLFNIKSETTVIEPLTENMRHLFFGKNNDLFYLNQNDVLFYIVSKANRKLSFWDEFEDNYSVKVKGQYSLDTEEKALTFMQAIENHQNFKDVLKKIVWVESFNDETVAGQAIYFSSGTIKLVYNAPIGHFTHELAHLWTFRLIKRLSSFKQKWMQIKGYAYESLIKKNDLGYYRWNFDQFDLDDANFGFARPYGNKNFYEDVATMVELVWTGETEDLQSLLNEQRFSKIYREKMQLLIEYGFLNQQQENMILKAIKP